MPHPRCHTNRKPLSYSNLAPVATNLRPIGTRCATLPTVTNNTQQREFILPESARIATSNIGKQAFAFLLMVSIYAPGLPVFGGSGEPYYFQHPIPQGQARQADTDPPHFRHMPVRYDRHTSSIESGRLKTGSAMSLRPTPTLELF